MPSISNDVIRALYEICGNDDFPVEEYCIGCENCEHHGFPCLNCAHYVFGGRLGQGCNVDEEIPINDDIDNSNDEIHISDMDVQTIVDNLIYETITNNLMDNEEIENVRNLP